MTVKLCNPTSGHSLNLDNARSIGWRYASAWPAANPTRLGESNGARSVQSRCPVTKSARSLPTNGPIVSPAAPRPLPTAKPPLPLPHPREGRISTPRGRKPTRVSIIVAGARPEAILNASVSTSACPNASVSVSHSIRRGLETQHASHLPRIGPLTCRCRLQADTQPS